MTIFRILKKTGKILLITILSVILLIVVLLFIAKLNEERIHKMALNEVSQMINAPVKVDSISLLLFRKFPYATVEFIGFNLGSAHADSTHAGENTFSDTLLSIQKLYVSLKSKPLIKNKIDIEKIEIKGMVLDYFVDSLGASNFDFLIGSDTVKPEDTIVADTSSTILDVLLKKLTIHDLTVNYKDESLKAAARIHIPGIEVSGKIYDEYYAANTIGSIFITDCSFDNTNISLMHQTALNFDLTYDSGSVEIEQMELITDGAILKVNGNTVLTDSIYVDLNVDLSDIKLHELIKYAPKEILSEFGILDVKGNLSVNAKLKGYVFDTLLLPRVDARVSMNKGTIRTVDYPELKHLSFNGAFSVPNPYDLTSVIADFSSVKLATKKSKLDIAFKVSNLEQPVYKVKTLASINLDEFNAFLPDSSLEYISGNMDLNISTKGKLPENIGLSSADYFLKNTRLELKLHNVSTAIDSVSEIKNLSLNFVYDPAKRISIRGLTLEAPAYDIILNNGFLLADYSGKISDLNNLSCAIDTFYFKSGSNYISGKASVSKLDKPSYTINTKLKLDLEEISRFIPDSLVEYVSGQVEISVNSYGTIDLDSIDQQAIPIAFEQTKLAAKIKDFKFSMPDDTLTRINHLSLDFAMADDTMKIDHLHANAHGIDLWIDSTEIWNVYKAFLQGQKDKKLIVNSHIRLSDIDYAMFGAFMETDSTLEQTTGSNGHHSSEFNTANNEEIEGNAENEDSAFVIPPYILRGTLAVNSIKYDQVFLENVSTKFRIADSLYVVDQLKFNTFGGDMLTSARYDFRDDSLTFVEFQNEINNVDIKQLLIDNDNFGQAEITSENIDGILTSKFNGKIVLQDTNLLYDEINVKGDFELKNGGIYNYEPAMELSKFTKLKELDNIIFQTFESSVFIYNNRVFFPKTDIVSTALDISVYGMQSFEDDYEYHLIVHLGDVLLGKSKKLLKKQGMESDVFKGEDNADRSGLYLVSLDRDGETKNGFDNKNLQKRMRATIRVQERGLSLVFYPKMVNFSTDIDRKEYKRKKEE